MPIHDWTRVDAGLFHAFHQRWTVALCDALNAGLLPADFYALPEQVIGGPVPDVLTLQRSTTPRSSNGTGLAVQTAPPKTRVVRQAETKRYASKANRIVVRHRHGRVVAVIEIVSPGNKDSRSAIQAFVRKLTGLLENGVHLLIVDLLPPTNRDPQGIHKAIWDEIVEEPFELPADRRLTLVAYEAGWVLTAYVEQVAVGDELPDMAVFLEPGMHIPAPLEATYQTAWSVFPLKELLEPPPGAG